MRKGPGKPMFRDKISIAFLDNMNKLGGAQLYLCDLISYMDRSKFDVWVNLPNECELEPLLSFTGAKFLDFRIPEIKEHPITGLIRMFKLSIKAAQLFKRENVILVHAHSVPALILSIFIKLWHRIKVVWRVHDYFTSPILTRILSIFSDRIIANSRFTQRFLESKCGIPYKKLRIGTDFINPRYLKQITIEENEKRNCSVNVKIGVFGRVVPWKGHEFFLSVAEELKTDNNVEFYIIGSVSDFQRKELKRRVLELNISDRVHILGYYPPLESLKIMSEMDIVVSCSQRPEPLGRTLIEAGLLGKPVVAFDEGGPKEIAVNGVTGYLVPCNNLQAFTEALRKLVRNNMLRMKMGQEARRIIRERFCVHRVIKQFEGVYEDVIKS